MNRLILGRCVDRANSATSKVALTRDATVHRHSARLDCRRARHSRSQKATPAHDSRDQRVLAGRNANGLDIFSGMSATGSNAEIDTAASTRRTRPRPTVLVTIAAGMVGVAVGLGIFTFGYGNGASYLSNDPTACTNCHVMQAHYDSWLRSSHARSAGCNDCHLAHDFVGKWLTKADNGLFHSIAFTTGDFHEPIQIKPRNRRVTQKACLACHEDLVNHMRPVNADQDMLWCVHCHSDVGHARR